MIAVTVVAIKNSKLVMETQAKNDHVTKTYRKMVLANIVGQAARKTKLRAPKRVKAHRISLKMAHQPYPIRLVEPVKKRGWNIQI